MAASAAKARKTNSACASMKNAKGVCRVSPFSLSRVRNAACPLPVGFAFYYLFSNLKRYFELREPIGYCPDYDNRQTRWAKAAVQIMTHDWPPLADCPPVISHFGEISGSHQEAQNWKVLILRSLGFVKNDKNVNHVCCSLITAASGYSQRA